MYFHPLQEDILKLSDADVSKRIKELSRKVGIARRFGRNPDILHKLQEALQTYQAEIRNHARRRPGLYTPRTASHNSIRRRSPAS